MSTATLSDGTCGAHIGILRHKSKCNPAAHNTPILSPCKIYNSGFYQTSRWRIRFLAMLSVSFDTPLWSRLKYVINHLINCPKIHGPRRMKSTYFGDVTFLLQLSSGQIFFKIFQYLLNASEQIFFIDVNAPQRCIIMMLMFLHKVDV